MHLKPFNISLPAGTTNHGDPDLLCPPTSWTSVAVFFIGNYLTHAITVHPPSSTPVIANMYMCFGALLVPATGLIFGLNAVYRSIRAAERGMRRTEGSELEKALAAGALCMYVRSNKWPPKSVEQGVTIPARVLGQGRMKESLYLVPRQNAKQLQAPWIVQTWIRWFGPELQRSIDPGCLQTDGQDSVNPFEIRMSKALKKFMSNLLLRIAGTFSGQKGLLCLIDAVGTHSLRNPDKASAGSWNFQGSVSLPTQDNNQDSISSRCLLLEPNAVSQGLRCVNPDSVYGVYYEDEAYDLVTVPYYAVIDPPVCVNEIPVGWQGKARIYIAKSRSMTRGVAALLQLCFSVFSLTRVQGNQLEIYGYAAFSLTVAPYVVMAFVNLVASICMPYYASLYLVRNDVMDEIEKFAGVKFDGVVGTLKQHNFPASKALGEQKGETIQELCFKRDENGVLKVSTDQNTAFSLLHPTEVIRKGIVPRQIVSVGRCGILASSDTSSDIPLENTKDTLEPNKTKKRWLLSTLSWFTRGRLIFLMTILGLILAASPIAIVGALSGFRKGPESTRMQRGVLLSWLLSGQIFGPFLGYLMTRKYISTPIETVVRYILFFPTKELCATLGIIDEHELDRKEVTVEEELVVQETKFDEEDAQCNGQQTGADPVTEVKIRQRRSLTFVVRKIQKHMPGKVILPVFYVTVALYCGLAGIWGFIIVGQMLYQYGNCIRIY